MEQAPLWQRVIALVLIPVIVPAAAIAALVSRPIRRTPEDVANYLSGFIDGSSSLYDWDDFTSLKIADPLLDDIRARAAAVNLPTTLEDELILRQLLAEVQALERKLL